MYISKEFRTNWKLKEMKRNNPLIYFTLLRKQCISVPYLNRKMIPGKELYLVFTMRPQGGSAGLFALQLPSQYLPTNFKYFISTALLNFQVHLSTPTGSEVRNH